MFYKSARIINGKVGWIIKDGDFNIIQKPTIEQIKMVVIGDPPKKCCKCRCTDTYVVLDGYEKWHNHQCNQQNFTGTLCNLCYASLWRVPDWKTGNLDPSSSSGRGFIGQQIVAKRYDVEDCNLKMNNFHFYVDLSKITEHGYSEVKIASFNVVNKQWKFGTNRKQEYDTLFLICMDNNWPWKDVKKVFAVPWKNAINRKSITIYYEPPRSVWYEDYKIDVKSFNDVYHKMKLENCNVLRKDKNKNKIID